VDDGAVAANARLEVPVVGRMKVDGGQLALEDLKNAEDALKIVDSSICIS
jgi:hypothetical protein